MWKEINGDFKLMLLLSQWPLTQMEPPPLVRATLRVMLCVQDPPIAYVTYR